MSIRDTLRRIFLPPHLSRTPEEQARQLRSVAVYTFARMGGDCDSIETLKAAIDQDDFWSLFDKTVNALHQKWIAEQEAAERHAKMANLLAISPMQLMGINMAMRAQAHPQ